jgi:hypothetical protein
MKYAPDGVKEESWRLQRASLLMMDLCALEVFKVNDKDTGVLSGTLEHWSTFWEAPSSVVLGSPLVHRVLS